MAWPHWRCRRPRCAEVCREVCRGVQSADPSLSRPRPISASQIGGEWRSNPLSTQQKPSEKKVQAPPGPSQGSQDSGMAPATYFRPSPAPLFLPCACILLPSLTLPVCGGALRAEACRNLPKIELFHLSTCATHPCLPPSPTPPGFSFTPHLFLTFWHPIHWHPISCLFFSSRPPLPGIE